MLDGDKETREGANLAFGFGHVTLEVPIQWAEVCRWIWSVDSDRGEGWRDKSLAHRCYLGPGNR